MELLAKVASRRGPRGSYKPRAPKPQHRASDIDIVALNENAITVTQNPEWLQLYLETNDCFQRTGLGTQSSRRFGKISRTTFER